MKITAANLAPWGAANLTFDDGSTAHTDNINTSTYADALMVYVQNGGVCGAYVEPKVPDQVNLWQAKAVLHNVGKLDAANAAIAAANNPVLTAFWAGATAIDRTSPTLMALAQNLGMSSADVDAMFIAAAKIAL